MAALFPAAYWTGRTCATPSVWASLAASASTAVPLSGVDEATKAWLGPRKPAGNAEAIVLYASVEGLYCGSSASWL